MVTYHGVPSTIVMYRMRPRVAVNTAQHKTANLLRTRWGFLCLCVSMYLLWGSAQCGPETPKGWTPRLRRGLTRPDLALIDSPGSSKVLIYPPRDRGEYFPHTSFIEKYTKLKKNLDLPGSLLCAILWISQQHVQWYLKCIQTLSLTHEQ